jgi:hypothetical protein
MITRIEELEKILNESYENWTEDTLLKIVQDEKTLEIFTPELATYLFDNRSNDNLHDILLPVKYGHQLREVQKYISSHLEMLDNGEITLEELFKVIRTMKSDGNVFSRGAAYFTILASPLFDDEDISKDVETIESILNELIEITSSIDIYQGSIVINEILNFIIPIRELYFGRYEVDVLTDLSKLQELFEKFNELEQNSIDELMDEFLEDDEDQSE